MIARDPMPIAVRGYVPGDSPGVPRFESKKPRIGPSDYTLIFDTETATDAAQQLRFGTFQVWRGAELREHGVFCDPQTLSTEEIPILERYAEAHGLTIRTVAEFIEEIFFPYGYDLRATIAGFNLPFDISRLAISHGSARGKMMRGGFTFKLSPRKDRPAVQVKHLSRRASVIQFAAPGKQRAPRGQRRRGIEVKPHRGFFVDLKTIAAALTSRSFSLGSLAEFLDVDSKKLATDEHGARLTEEYVDYAMRDVQTTWECFVALRDRYAAHALTETPMHKIYSEAGLGKAYLGQMGIRPWREVQPDAPPELIGAIVSAYYGGRSEVHIRRDIRQVAYCDFLSMYPTVCVLMKLWRFVIAQGMTWSDATTQTRRLLDTVTIADIQRPEFWRDLPVLVEIAPDDDLFPVRARYGTEPNYTIGLNHLSSPDAPLWFTLADAIASKLLTGKTPKIVRALRFQPGKVQPNLRPIESAGQAEYRVDPRAEDFYRRLIDLRAKTKKQMKAAAGAKRDALDAAQMAQKILANSTSYGIFMELNVEELTDSETALCFSRNQAGFPTKITQSETPGRYFHPLLATLITGAARLMLATAERLTLDAGLDWVFCDTDSLAIAKPQDMADHEFIERVDAVRHWFDPLNPYAAKGPILKLEEANLGIAGSSSGKVLAPLFCFAISAKRYALFNLDTDGRPIIRKASAHGLGHLIAPYDEASAPASVPNPIVPLGEIGVERWQHDVWYRIVSAALASHPERVSLADLPCFNAPAVSRYGATTPRLLRWFKNYNQGRPYREQVRPFGFMLAFQAGRLADFWDGLPAASDITGSVSKRRWRTRRKDFDAPRAVAPFDRDVALAAKGCFDRDTGKPVQRKRLKTYGQALLRYHLHPEAKFLGGNYTDSGVTRRRHIEASAVQIIGKEANRWEEQFHLGAEPEAQSEYGLQPEAQVQAMALIGDAVQRYGVRAVAKAARVSRNVLAAAIQNAIVLPDSVVQRLTKAVATLERKTQKRKQAEGVLLARLREWAASVGIRGCARAAGVDDRHLARVLSGERSITRTLMQQLSSR